MHYYTYPPFALLELVLDFGCLENTAFDLAYATELDPLWDVPELAALLTPETFLFANPASRLRQRIAPQRPQAFRAIAPACRYCRLLLSDASTGVREISSSAQAARSCSMADRTSAQDSQIYLET